MITVIIAGGSSEKLWPLSTTKTPKHLVALADQETLIQSTFNKATKYSSKIYLVTEARYFDEILKQLPGIKPDNIIIEPDRRGTANCVILALDYISKKENSNDPISFIYTDSSVADDEKLSLSMKLAEKISCKEQKITLLGTKPLYPATNLGYIKLGKSKSIKNQNKAETYYENKSFKEKPSKIEAKKYIESGKYLWNCGYFIGSINIFKDKIKKDAPKLFENFKKLQDSKNNKKEIYLSFNDYAIDTVLFEKTKDLLVIASEFGWADIGSFDGLFDVIKQDELGNSQRGRNVYTYDNKNTLVRNETQTPLVTIGLEDIVVVQTKNGVLVSKIGKTSQIADVAKKINLDLRKELEGRMDDLLKLKKEPLIDEIESLAKKSGYSVVDKDTKRPWGGFLRFDNNDADRFIKSFFPNLLKKIATEKSSTEISPKILIVSPSTRLSWQIHNRRSEIWCFLTDGFYVKSGEENDANQEPMVARVDQVVNIGCRECHRIVGLKNGYSLVAEIWRHTDPNNPSDENDIIRIQDDFSRN